MTRKRYNYVNECILVLVDDKSGRKNRTQTAAAYRRILRKLVREAAGRAVQCGGNGETIAETANRIAKELIP